MNINNNKPDAASKTKKKTPDSGVNNQNKSKNKNDTTTDGNRKKSTNKDAQKDTAKRKKSPQDKDDAGNKVQKHGSNAKKKKDIDEDKENNKIGRFSLKFLRLGQAPPTILLAKKKITQSVFGIKENITEQLADDVLEEHIPGLSRENEHQLAEQLRELYNVRQLAVISEVESFLPECFQFNNIASNVVVVSRFRGAVVFSDASGFTALTEQLAKKPNGAELLSSCLNKFFTPLIDIITSFRGDVIKFSGDALTITFEPWNETTYTDNVCGNIGCSHSPYELACIRATACCLEIHKRLHNFDTGEGDVKLTLHIGVGAGELTMLQVGGMFGRYEYVISGTPLEQISIAEPLASSGETVLSPQCWEAVDKYFTRGEPLPDDTPAGFARLGDIKKPDHSYPCLKNAASQNRYIYTESMKKGVKPSEIEEILHSQATVETEAEEQARLDVYRDQLFERSKRFVPRAVLQQLEAGTVGNVNEMRNVTIIFVQIQGVKVYTDEGVPIAQKLISYMQEACYGMEGSLNKFLVDDKGLLFLLVFGLSPLVHTDDPDRAIRCSFQAIQHLRELKLMGRFGVTTGRVFCGVVGSKGRREYTVMGDTVNLSARLMANTDNLTVLIDEDTYKRVNKSIACEVLEPIFVKGKKNAIKIFRPYDPTTIAQQSHELFKRQMSWGLTSTAMPEKYGKNMRLNWQGCTLPFGGQSLLPLATKWHGNTILESTNVKSSGGLVITGPSGIGKVELGEMFVLKLIREGYLIASGVTLCLANQEFIFLQELLESLFNNLLQLTTITIEKWILQNPADIPLLKKLRMLPVNSGDTEDPMLSVSHVTQSLIKRLILEITRKKPIAIILREKLHSALFPGPLDLFWDIAAFLLENFAFNSNKMECQNPVYVIIIARKMQCSAPSFPTSRIIQLQPMSNTAARHLIWLCLNRGRDKQRRYTKELIFPKRFLKFVFGVSLFMPDFIQETVNELLKERIVEMTPEGEVIGLSDITKVDVSGWAHTKMVGGVQSKIEALGPVKMQLVKLATVFEGPFSALDLLAVFSAEEGRSAMRVYDQVRIILACVDLVRSGLLEQYEYKGSPLDKAPHSVPRWTMSNFLYRKICESYVLFSQRILIKRCVLMQRAIRVELPKRMAEKERRLKTISGKQQEEKYEDSGAESCMEEEDYFVCFMDEDSSDQDDDVSDAGDNLPNINNTDHEEFIDFGKDEDFPAPKKRPSAIERHLSRTSSSQFRSSVYGVSESGIHSEEVRNNQNLLESCCKGDLVETHYLLHEKASANAVDSRGVYAIHFAAMSGSVDVLRLLISHHADTSAKTHSGIGIVVLAAQYNRLTAVKYFVDSLNMLMESGGRKSAQEADGVDLLDPSFWEARLDPIRSLRDVARPFYPVYVSRDPSNVFEFGRSRRKVRIAIRNILDHNTTRSATETFVKKTSASLEEIELPPPPETEENDNSNNAVAGKKALIKGSAEKIHKNIKFSDYYKKYCRWIRPILRGQFVTLTMVLTLFVALFIPDIWVIAHIATSDVLDLLLYVCLGLFGMECVLLFSSEPSYRFSFFFWMDLIGTLSVLCDVTIFGIGRDASKLMTGSHTEDGNLIARYARTGKLAARAGRITRLVKLLRFLPGVKSDDESASEKRSAATTAQLGRVISKRVALLSIILVAILPLFTFITFPTFDSSSTIWVNTLQRYTNSLLEGSAPQSLVQQSFEEFGRFYNTQNYGPFEVCIGELKNNSNDGDVDSTETIDSFNCQKKYDYLWKGFENVKKDSFKMPTDYAALHIMTSDSGEGPKVNAKFDFSFAQTLDSVGSIALMVATIFIMCSITTVCSSSVNDIAVKPIQRMLESIRKTAKRIFTSVDALQDPDQDENADEENEILLLEAVVKKISRLSEIIMKKNPWGDVTTLTGEERGILALADVGNTSTEEVGAMLVDKLEDAKMQENRDLMAKQQLDNNRMTWDKVDSWDFSVLEYSVEQLKVFASWMVINHSGLHGIGRIASTEPQVVSCVDKIMADYPWNSYHNWNHAVDVAHTVTRIYTVTCKHHSLAEPLEQYAMIISALAHDIGHPGVNNPFLIETNHDLALRYNDRSPLENMSACKLFEITSKQDANVFQNFSKSEYKTIRQLCITSILHTDMIAHFGMVKEINLLVQMKKEIINENTFNKETLLATNIHQIFEGCDRMFFAKLVLHLADISNPLKPWKICFSWAMRILDEFFAQGDQEKSLGLPVQILNDREKVSKSHSQIGFLEFIVIPCAAGSLQLLPMLYEFGVNCSINLRNWQKTWEQEEKDMEESHKMEERVSKTIASLDTSLNMWKEHKQEKVAGSLTRRQSQSMHGRANFTKASTTIAPPENERLSVKQ